MKNPILLILIFFFYFGASAQLDTFDISNYILPDFQIKSNAFDFSFGGDGNNSFNDGINGERKYENHRGGLNFYMLWKSIENSREKQKDYYSRISISPLFRLTKEEGEESLINESIYVPLNFSGDRIIRHFRKAKRFIQYAIPYNLNVSYQDQHYKDEINEYDEAYFVASASLQPEILIGFGMAVVNKSPM